jgi:alkane 1-monooxygenase
MASETLANPRRVASHVSIDVRYLASLWMEASALVSVVAPGAWTWLTFVFTFGVVPLAEAALPGTPRNLTAEEEARASSNRFYDLFAWACAPAMVALLVLYLRRVSSPGTTWFEAAGMTLSVGVMCAIRGIVVGHELMHRSGAWDRAFGSVLLLTSLNLHFPLYHNRSHHKWVATPSDPATARRGESLYAFVPRSMIGNYLTAWRLERDRLVARGRSPWSWRNAMLVGQAVQLGLLIGVLALAGPVAALGLLAVALLGHLIYQGGNYIEHYGMARREVRPGVYEPCAPRHSWNSNHPLGRTLLFELSRHSDHHFKISRPYQVLRHFDESPQLPWGYPTALLVSLVPPLWFRRIDPLLDGLDGAGR